MWKSSFPGAKTLKSLFYILTNILAKFITLPEIKNLVNLREDLKIWFKAYLYKINCHSPQKVAQVIMNYSVRL